MEQFENVTLISEENIRVYKKFINFEQERLHKLDYCYLDRLNAILAPANYEEQIDIYLKQEESEGAINCNFELKEIEEELPRNAHIQKSYSQDEFITLVIRTALRTVNRESKLYDSMSDDDLIDFDDFDEGYIATYK